MGAGSVRHMFVKICGITRPADAIAALDAGADAIGLNFVPTSRRYIDLEVARSVLAVVPDRMLTVGVFSNHTTRQVIETVEALGLGAAQLHGEGTPEHTAAIADVVDTVIEVVAVDRLTDGDIDDHGADIVMIDGPTPGAGVTFDWDSIGNLVATHKILLAGGLRPENVGEAIRRVRPWGVDVASGVEVEPAVKDPRAIARFVAEARRAERLTTS